MNLDFIGLLIIILGYIIGFGSVIVIDIHGLLGRKSKYWTEATTRTHKITKPLIWIGIIFTIIGGIIFYRDIYNSQIYIHHLIISSILITNGMFLSFYVSPILLQRELNSKSHEILPKPLQNKIIVSFIISDLGWLFSIFILVNYIIQKT